MILMLSLVSCEKEVDLSNLIISSEEPLSYIYWSESSDDILYIIEDPYVSYGLGVSIYTVDITTKENRKIIDIINHAGYIISLTNNKIYYTNCLDPDNKKLYSWDISGQTGELVKDSLVYVTYLSKKYLAYLKNIPNELTPLWTTVLYDLESGSERIIAPGSNNFPLSISPDGSQLLLGVSNKDGLPSLVNTQTGDITDLTLSYYSSACGYHWKEGAVYTMYSDGLECSIKNMRTGNILISLEDLNNGCSCSFNFSPSGQFIYNVNEVRTAQGKLEKSYLNLINTNNLEKTVIDLGDRLVYQVKFSPDETRIAYIGDQNKIYILNL
ncbi:MAG: hypothetical protein A2Y71_15085 [Bacteroidetes bacterium RBG_13_42_15]|nr:MAG: hypothetical protein A2Y71_15085 [Bacteroidetes bacterium RBG_13_42_15]